MRCLETFAIVPPVLISVVGCTEVGAPARESPDPNRFGTTQESPDEYQITRKVVCEVPGEGQIVLIYSNCLYHNGRVIRELYPASKPESGASKGAPIANFTVPSVGSKFVYRRSKPDGSYTITSWTVIADRSPYNGRSTIRRSDGQRVLVSDRETGNLMAILKDGKEVTSIKPYAGTYNWPLWVGKEWSHTSTFIDHKRRRSFNNMVRFHKVEAYEDVTVPAGRYKAFRVSGAANSSNITVWYAENFGTVKVRWERFGGTSITELVSFIKN